MKPEYLKKTKTYGDFAKLVKKLMHPPMSSVFREIGISDQLGNYYLQQSAIFPNKELPPQKKKK